MPNAIPPDWRPCYQCKFFAGLDGTHSGGHCTSGKGPPIVARPEMGCCDWSLDPSGVRTREDWIARHGLPITGFEPFSVGKWPTPLTAAEIRAAYERNRTPEVRQLAWEIGRLQDLAYRTRLAVLSLTRPTMPPDHRAQVERLAELLAEEPSVRERLAKDGTARKRRG